MSTAVSKIIHLFNHLTEQQQEELKTDLHLIQQVSAASDGETLYQGAPKAHLNDRRRAALALSRVTEQLLHNLSH
jgi:hypothetical protein